MRAKVYSMAQCQYCVEAKLLLNENNIDFDEIVVREDITVDEFLEKFPGVTSVPVIVIDDKVVIGYNALKEELSCE